MSLILVVEPEERYVHRVRDALGSEGWRTRVVSDRASALQAAASEAPNLVLVSANVEGASALIDSFARRSGGPGVVALVDEAAAGGASAEGMGADDLLTKPFTDQELRLSVRRGLIASAKAPAKSAGPSAGSAESAGRDTPFTSADIFGDLVAEVEGELARSTTDEEAVPPTPPTPAAPAPTPPASVTATPAAAAPAAPPPAAPAASPASEPPASAPPTPSPPPAAASPPPTGASVLDGPEGLSTVRIPIVGRDQPDAPSEPTPATPPSAGATPPAPTPGAVPPAEPTAAPPSADRDQQEIERRLEQTLSGVLDAAASKPASVKPTAPKPAAPATDGDVDSLLSETLMGLDLRAKPEAPAAGAEDPLAGLDLSGLDEIARPAKPAAAGPKAGEQSSSAEVQPPPGFEPSLPKRAEAELGIAAPASAPKPAEESKIAEPAAAEPQPPGVTPSSPPAVEAEPPAAEPPAAPPQSVSPQSVAPPGGAPAPSAAAAAEDPERFGQYTLQERIAVGGMAEVWKARMRGVEGFQKTVAIKKILPHLSDNAEFVTMFIDEAKLAAQLNHPNIIHIYDLGKIADSYYIAMEYVEGRNLRTLLDASNKKQRPIPPGLAMLIAARLASGLDYAHKKRDFDNRELGLVHRDVSPQNVLISFEGAIKLCDFGIAKAVAKASHTQMGALKGKLQYMSPEQAWGRTVDARSDIFSLGSLLFEMLTGQRLFTGDSEISVLEAVRECHVQEPREVVGDLPEEANAIVMKALAKEPEHRYQAAGAMQQALEGALYSLKPTPGPAELTVYLEELSGARPVTSGSREAGTGSRSWTGSAAGGSSVSSVAASPATGTGTGSAVTATGTGTGTGSQAAALESTGFDDVSVVAEPLAPDLETPKPISPQGDEVEAIEEEGGRGRLWLILAILLAAGLLVAAFVVFKPLGGDAGDTPSDSQTPSEPSQPVEPPPPLLEDTLPGEGEGEAEGTGDGEPAAAEVSAAAAPPTPAPAEPAETDADQPTDAAEIESMVAQRLAEREAQLRAEREAELRRLEAELAATRDQGAPEEQPPAIERGEPEPAAASAEAGTDAEPPPDDSAPAPDDSTAEESEPAAASEVQPAATAPSPPPSSSPPPPSSQSPTPADNAARSSAAAPSTRAETAPEPAPVREGDLVQPGAGVVPPKLVSFVKPQYPPVARRMRIEGEVIVAVLVDERGRVIESRYVETIRQNVGINEAALEAARSAKYEPATKNGVRVKMWTNLKLPFRL